MATAANGYYYITSVTHCYVRRYTNSDVFIGVRIYITQRYTSDLQVTVGLAVVESDDATRCSVTGEQLQSTGTERWDVQTNH